MSDYGPDVAAHYAAFRPSLHGLLLQRALGEGRFAFGVDVGSGTGVSTLALAAHCEAVVGVEPSAAMRHRATPHPRVRYVDGRTDDVPLGNAVADVVTLAGVLSYANTPATHAELRRICRPGATVVCYDFSLDLGPLLAPFGLPPADAPEGYDHAASLHGAPGFAWVDGATEKIALMLTPAEQAHVLLADDVRYPRLAAQARGANPFAWLVAQLDAATPVIATCPWSVFTVESPAA